MKETKLLNCPFCGGEAIVSQDSDGYYVTCKNDCVVQMKSYLEIEAIKAWNTRVPMERIIERLKDASFPKSLGNIMELVILKDKAIEILKEESGIE